MEQFLPIISLSFIGVVLGAIFMLGFKLDQNDWRTLLYPVLMLLLGGLGGLLMDFSSAGNPLVLPLIYVLVQVAFLLFGIFHLWLMYRKLIWSKRNTVDLQSDSVVPEMIYTFLIFSFAVVGFLVGYGYFAGFAKIGTYWGIGIPFIIPFLFMKSYDFLNQIPKRDFSQKWKFTNEAIKEFNWNWENEIWVNFEVKEKLVDAKVKTNRLVAFKILAPRRVPIREVFRLAIREYNKKGPTIIVQDLGFEQENKDRFWWLFSIKFEWKRPNTWFRKIRYLDPYSSSVSNEISPKDTVLARRMFTQEAFQNKEPYFDDNIPMGQLGQ